MKNICLSVYLLLTQLCVHSQVFQWVRTGGGPMNDEGYCISLDPSENAHVTGIISSTAAIGGSVFTSAGASDMFVAKYNSSGASIWEESSCGAPNIAGGHVLNVDNSGNVYVIGEFEDTMVIGGTTLISAGLTDVFIAKYNNGGSLLWAVRAGGPGKEGGNSIRTDLNGNVYISGYFSDTASFGAFTQVSAGGEDAFIVKINPLGSFLWFTCAGGTLDDEGKGISVDNNSNVWLTGFFNGTAAFGTTNLTSTNPQREMYAARLSSAGVFQWAVKGGGTGIDMGYEIAADNAGNAYVTGSFQNTALFGTTTIISNGGDDIYIAKYNSIGNAVWVNTAGGPINDKAYAVAYDNSGRIYITGSYDSLITLNGNTHFSNGGKDVFVACYNTTGTLLDALTGGGPGFDRGYGIACSNNGDVYITGTFEESAIFGSNTVTSAGLYDIFIAKISGMNSITDMNNSKNSFDLFPNPAVSSIEIKGNDVKANSTVTITNPLGSKIASGVIEENGNYTFDISFLERGVYYLCITSEDGKMRSKSFVKN